MARLTAALMGCGMVALLFSTTANAGAIGPLANPDGAMTLAPTQVVTTTGVRPASSGLEPAPVPDFAKVGPDQVVAAEPRFGPRLFSSKTQFRGDGYSPGSTAQSAEEQHARPGLGFDFKVPVQ